MEGRNGFYVMTFNSTSHSIQTEKKAQGLFRIAVIPTPRELTNDCGLAIKFLDGDIDTIKEFHKTLTVPADLYFLSDEKIDGKRKAEKLP
jgi:hypothetical protein